MEFGERVNHIKPVHIYYSGVYDQLRAGCEYTVKVEQLCRNNNFMTIELAYQNVINSAINALWEGILHICMRKDTINDSVFRL